MLRREIDAALEALPRADGSTPMPPPQSGNSWDS